MPTYISDELRSRFAWLGTLVKMEDLLGRMEAELAPEVLPGSSVTMVMKYEDFKAFVEGVRDVMFPPDARRM